MKLIVGLGNPGDKYKATRHNLGSLVVGQIAAKLKKRFKYSIFAKSKIAYFNQAGEQIALLLPLTYMNLSGKAVSYMIRKKHLALEGVLVVCDDVNLDFAKIRARASGSDGGHNGLKSIIENLKTERFPRLRIGIGQNKAKDFSKFVLEEFSSQEEKDLGKVIDEAVEAVFCWMNSGIKEVMNKYN